MHRRRRFLVSIASEEQFNRFSISAYDFQRAIDFATEGIKHPANTIIYEALLFAAIMCYWRPFSPNERGDAAEAAKRITLDQLGINLAADELRLHEGCKSLRNEALAHSAWERNPTRLRDSGVVASRPFSLLTPPFDLPALIRLAEKMRAACEHRRADFVLGKRRGAV